jgi:predicted Fe-Mo cluster-binding NifX family protein
MRIAVPVWAGRISPVFDVARRLVLADCVEGAESRRSEVDLEDTEVPLRAKRVAALGVDVLICGAVSRQLTWLLAGEGVRVISQMCGRVDQVIQAYLSGGLGEGAFLMPGCCGRHFRRHRRRRGGGGRWR